MPTNYQITKEMIQSGKNGEIINVIPTSIPSNEPIKEEPVEQPIEPSEEPIEEEPVEQPIEPSEEPIEEETIEPIVEESIEQQPIELHYSEKLNIDYSLKETYFNIEVLNILADVDLNCEEYDHVKMMDKGEQIKVKQMKKNYKKRSDSNTLYYKQSPHGQCRYYLAKINNNSDDRNIYGFQNIKGCIRRLLGDGKYHDIDFTACHQNLLKTICKTYKIDCSFIDEYLSKREDILHETEVAYNVDRRKAKDLFIILTFGGSFETWRIDNNINKHGTKPTKYIDAYNKQMSEIPRKLTDKQVPQFSKFLGIAEDFKHKKTEKAKHYSALGMFLQHLETQAMFHLEAKCINHGLTISAKIHDGNWYPKSTSVLVDRQFLDECEQYVFKKTGFYIPIEDKETKPTEDDKDWLNSHKQFTKKHLKDTQEVTDKTKEYLVDNDFEAGKIFINLYKDDIKLTNGRMFVRKYGRVWTEQKAEVERTLKSKCLNLKIMKLQANGNKVHYSRNVKTCNSIIEAGLSEMEESPKFAEEMWWSSLKKLCFKNGVYDFERKKFFNWEQLDAENIEFDTVQVISRDYNEIRNEELIDEVNSRIWEAIFSGEPELMNYFKRFMVRGLGGYIQDKQWGSGVGERNSGKGVLCNCFENSFEGYIGTTNSENLLQSSKAIVGGDEAKKLSWLYEYESKRLCFTNELTIDDPTKKINGTPMKKFASGTDTIQCRKNHCDEVTMRLQTRFILFCNDVPKITPEDTYDSMALINFPNKFVDDETYAIKKEYSKMYKLQDDTIKEWITRPEVIDAFIHTVFDSFGPKQARIASVVQEIKDLSDEPDFDDEFNDKFTITHDDKDQLPIKIVSDEFKKVSSQKINRRLKARGLTQEVVKIDGKANRVWKGIKVKMTQKEASSSYYEFRVQKNDDL
jgi:hypothetical protein